MNTGVTSPMGLWSLDFGNSVTGNANTLYFTAGVNNQKDGLFGALTFVPEPDYLGLFVPGIAGLLLYRLRRERVRPA